MQRVAILHSSPGPSVDFAAPIHTIGAKGVASTSQLRRVVRDWRPDVIQAHGGEAMKAAVLARLDVPIVYRRIGGAPLALQSGWRTFAYQLLVARTARVIAVAEAVRRESIALFKIPPDRIVTIPNAVDADRLILSADASSLRKALGIDACTPVFLSMGALTWEKDPLALLRVAAEVLRRSPDAVYVVLGDGPMRSQMEREVSVLGLHDRVRMLGVRCDVPDLLRLADALLFASRPDGMEGMPASLIEAGMLSTSSVAYDVAGVGEVVTDGETGRLVPWGEELCPVRGDARGSRGRRHPHHHGRRRPVDGVSRSSRSRRRAAVPAGLSGGDGRMKRSSSSSRDLAAAVRSNSSRRPHRTSTGPGSTTRSPTCCLGRTHW